MTMPLSPRAAKKAKRDLDRQIENIYYDVAQGVQINILDIPTIYQEAYAVAQDGPDAMRAQIIATVNRLRKN